MQKHKKSVMIILLIGFILCMALKLWHNNQENTIIKIEEQELTQEVDVRKADFADDRVLGYISIPDILLKNAPVRQGTELSTLSKAIGHFTQTKNFDGNVAMASHNGGGKGDYFKNLHKIKTGDTIYYNSVLGNRKYEVVSKTKIKETDMSCLEPSDENKLTLITCVRNQSELRLCVVAKGIKEE